MRALSVKLRAADPKLKRQLRKHFSEVANPLVAKVQQSILTAGHFVTPPRPFAKRHGVPGRTWHHEASLRAEIAGTIRSSVRFTRDGVALDIVSFGSRMPPGKGNLPHFVNEGRGWAHPVFARGERFVMGPSRAKKYAGLAPADIPLVHRGNWVWVREIGKPHWFEEPISRSAGDVKRAAQQAIDDVKKMLD
jgi:hypothetical protein